MKTLEPADLVSINKGKTCLVFSGAWCGPCKALMPVLDKAASTTSVKMWKVDVDEMPELASKWSVRSIPQAVCLKDGQVVEILNGAGSIRIDYIEKALQ